jgi:hypothetical protein
MKYAQYRSALLLRQLTIAAPADGADLRWMCARRAAKRALRVDRLKREDQEKN